MEIDNIITVVVAILTGMATAIPLIVKLVKTVQQAVQEKNWNVLLDLVMKLMSEAEQKFEDGATKKDWVISMVMASAEFVNYPIDREMLSRLIDDLCVLTKRVNYQNYKGGDNNG